MNLCQRHARVAAACVTGLILAAGAVRAGEPEVTGWWFDQSGQAGIRIERCGDRLCGTIRWLREPLAPSGGIRTDIHNDDPARRGQPICGLQILGNFRPDEPGEWVGGWIYNPEDGETYKSTMRLTEAGTLRVRGYVGISLLGKSQTWTRPAVTPAECRAG